MKRHHQVRLAATAMVGVFALSATAEIRAQSESSTASRPRTSGERVVTETPTPPPVNSDYRRAAEGQLPRVPATGAGTAPATGPAGAIDPAARPLTGPGRAGVAPAGMDVAMLIEHSIGMAIEASALQSIAATDASDPSRMLADHARAQMAESKAMLSRAANDGRGVDAASPARRFYSAASNYLTTLGALGIPTSPADRAQVAMINHSVKEVLDAGHIQQFGRAYAGSMATEQLVDHARMMKDGGMQTILKMAGNAPGDPNAAPTPTLLAQRGRELLEAADQLSSLPLPSAAPGNPSALNQNLPNPGRLQDTRPFISGGTQATGSPTGGTATGPAAGTPKDPSVIPNANRENPSNPPSNSNAGSRPR